MRDVHATAENLGRVAAFRPRLLVLHLGRIHEGLTLAETGVRSMDAESTGQWSQRRHPPAEHGEPALVRIAHQHQRVNELRHRVPQGIARRHLDVDAFEPQR